MFYNVIIEKQVKWRKINSKIAKWLVEWRLAFSGVVLATKSRKFRITTILVFLVFGCIMNLLANGLASFRLMSATNFAGIMKIIWNALLGLFGFNKNSFIDWLFLFCISLLQGILVGLIVLIWKKKKDDNTNDDSVSAQNAGIAAGLAVLGTGCPTCGTSLLAPILGAVFSSGSYAVAGVLSGIITVLAVVIALLTLKKVGLKAYVIITSDKYLKGRNSSGQIL